MRLLFLRGSEQHDEPIDRVRRRAAKRGVVEVLHDRTDRVEPVERGKPVLFRGAMELGGAREIIDGLARRRRVNHPERAREEERIARAGVIARWLEVATCAGEIAF